MNSTEPAAEESPSEAPAIPGAEAEAPYEMKIEHLIQNVEKKPYPVVAFHLVAENYSDKEKRTRLMLISQYLTDQGVGMVLVTEPNSIEFLNWNNEMIAAKDEDWIVQLPNESFTVMSNDEFEAYYRPSREDGNLVNHARVEMELLGEEPFIIEEVLDVVRAYAKMGHSGGSHAYFLPLISDLLNFKNLRPLTNRPEEWYHHEAEALNDTWQNKRNGEAFSQDGGKTYYLLSEREYGKEIVMHTSEPV